MYSLQLFKTFWNILSSISGNEEIEEETLLDPDYPHSEGSSDEEEPSSKKRKVTFKKRRWTKKEEEEINLYFASYLKSGTTPRAAACEKAKAKSKRDNGEIHKRENHLIIKKISAMNHSKKRKISSD